MGLFSKVVKSLSTPKELQEVGINFGPNLIGDMQSASKSNHGQVSIRIDFPPDLMQEIDDCINGHSATVRVLYDEEMQFLDIVGESFRQDDLQKLFSEVGDRWLSGFLFPEPFNPHDANAVSLMIISSVKKNPETKNNEFEVVQAGYLAKDQAKKVSKKVVSLLEGDAYIPVICKLNGGSSDKPNIGVSARAKTKKIRF